LALGPFVAAVLFFSDAGAGPARPHISAILGWVVVWWITEPIPLPMTAVLGATLAVVFEVAPARRPSLRSPIP